MAVITDRFSVNTKGFTDIVDITSQIVELTKKHEIQNANVHIYVIGSTASITTMEYEPGLIRDLPEALEKFAPVNKEYYHDQTWQDGNGYAHLRSSLIGTSENIPIVDGTPFLGTWQQIVLVDFDNKPRTRTILVQFLY